jgi:DNA invertase Pin-like site-specific DNA recombinase
MEKIKTIAIYVRVSTDKQEFKNQFIQLKQFTFKKYNCNYHKNYSDVISGKEDSRPGFDKLFSDAHKLQFNHLIFWSIDRFSRSGILFTLQKLKELEHLGITWESYQEPFFNTMGQFKELLISFMSTIAKIEKEKISERTKAGLERAKLEGKTLGRPKGSKDTKKRNKSNYYKRWEKVNNGVVKNE